MEINKFVTDFVNQFDPAPEELITAETEFSQISNWDSLTALAIIAMIDDEYGVNFTYQEMRGCTTIQDIFEIVKSKK